MLTLTKRPARMGPSINTRTEKQGEEPEAGTQPRRRRGRPRKHNGEQPAAH